MPRGARLVGFALLSPPYKVYRGGPRPLLCLPGRRLADFPGLRKPSPPLARMASLAAFTAASRWARDGSGRTCFSGNLTVARRELGCALWRRGEGVVLRGALPQSSCGCRRRPGRAGRCGSRCGYRGSPPARPIHRGRGRGGASRGPAASKPGTVGLDQAELARGVAVRRLEQAAQLELQHYDLANGAGQPLEVHDLAAGIGEQRVEHPFFRQLPAGIGQFFDMEEGDAAQPVELLEPRLGEARDLSRIRGGLGNRGGVALRSSCELYKNKLELRQAESYWPSESHPQALSGGLRCAQRHPTKPTLPAFPPLPPRRSGSCCGRSSFPRRER